MSFNGLTSPVIRKNTGDNTPEARSIGRHRQVIRHFEEAVRLHAEAIMYLEQSDRKGAIKSTLKAYNHTALAMEAQKKELEPGVPD